MKNLTDFTQYKLDKDIPKAIWNPYLSRYSSDYKVRVGEDNVSFIKCKYGIIIPYSLIKNYLLFCGEFPSPNKKTFFKKKFEGKAVEVAQEASDAISFKFKEKNLPILQDLFEVKKRIKLSKAESERRRQQLLKNIGH